MLHLGSPPQRKFPKKFLVAISYASEQRPTVLPIAESLEQKLGWGTVFLDEWYDVSGMEASNKLQEIYKVRAEVVIVGISGEYGKKGFTQIEFLAIQGRLKKLLEEPVADKSAPRPSDRIALLRVGSGEFDLLPDGTIWRDAQRVPPDYISDLIVERLRGYVPEAGKPTVFLAKTPPKLNNNEEIVSRPRLEKVLTALGVVVVPEGRPDAHSGAEVDSLASQMAECSAFVQLLTEESWEGDFDRVQHAMAQAAGLEMYRFRGEIDLKKVLEERRRFVEDGSIPGGFFDFIGTLTVSVKRQISKRPHQIRRWQQQERKARRPSGEDDQVQPFVHVAIRAGRPNEGYRPIFDFLHRNRKVLLDKVPLAAPSQRHDLNDAFHGFVIVCDGETFLAPDDGLKKSVSADLSRCRRIQQEYRDLPLPPVALVYWPPPGEVDWSLLVDRTPPQTHYIHGDSLESDFQKFLEEIREVREALSSEIREALS